MAMRDSTYNSRTKIRKQAEKKDIKGLLLQGD